MTAPAMPGTGFSQRTKRVYRSFTDQHGRTFEAWADATSNQPIGEFIPVGFQPPWLPPMRFARWAREGDLHFRWDYASMADELAASTASYYDDATKIAIQDHLTVPEVGGPVDRRVRSIIGPPPLSPAIPLAADEGDPWILGIEGADGAPELKAILNQGSAMSGREALELIKERVRAQIGEDAVSEVRTDDAGTPITYQEFMGEARKKGMSMADIALAWSAHKANLRDAA